MINAVIYRIGSDRYKEQTDQQENACRIVFGMLCHTAISKVFSYTGYVGRTGDWT